MTAFSAFDGEDSAHALHASSVVSHFTPAKDEAKSHAPEKKYSHCIVNYGSIGGGTGSQLEDTGDHSPREASHIHTHSHSSAGSVVVVQI